MYTVYPLTPYHTHLYNEGKQVAGVYGVLLREIHPDNMFYVTPMTKCSRQTQNNFFDNTEKAMYREELDFPGQLFLPNDLRTVICLVTHDNKVCIGRYGRLDHKQGNEEPYTLHNLPISVERLRIMHRGLFELISPFMR